MITIIALALLGLLTLFLGLMRRKAWLLPVILAVLAGTMILTWCAWDFHPGIAARMLIQDQQTRDFSLVMLFSVFLIFLFAGHYYRPVVRPLEDVYAVMLFALVGGVMMVLSGNLIVLFLGIETLSIALYILAGSHKEVLTSNEATLKYFLIGSFISVFLLFGIALIYGSTGSFDLGEIARYTGSHAGIWPPVFRAGLYLLIVGLAFKIALVPFHFWAPDVYEGTPTLLTAFMASMVKTAGIVTLFRLFTMGFREAHTLWEPTLGILAALTILLGNLTGLYQLTVKRMLAYSSIAHSGTMILAVLALGGQPATVLLFYTLTYSIATITAFAVIILVREVRGNDQIDSFNGLGKTNPVEAFCMAAALFSLTGIPPLAGFFAKFFLFSAAIHAGYLWLVLIAIAGSAVSAGYYFKPVIAMYLKEGDGMELKSTNSYRVFLVFVTALTFLLGILPFLVTIS